MIGAYFLYSDVVPEAEEALSIFAFARTRDQKVVSSHIFAIDTKVGLQHRE